MTKSIWRISRVMLISSSFVLIGCPADTEVGIAPGSTLERLTFTISRGSGGTPTELSSFVVESCTSVFGGNQDRFWELEPQDHPSSLGRLEYGSAPMGYTVKVRPRPLASNACYVALYGAKDELYFTTTASGEIRTITQEEAKQIIRNQPSAATRKTEG